MLQEFRAFMLRGNVIDLAVAVIIGAAFGAIVASLVNDVIMPPVGLITGNTDFSNMFVVLKEGTVAAGPYASVQAAKDAGAVTLRYGLFINTIINFIIIAFALFVIIKIIASTRRKEAVVAAATTRECPRCFMAVSLNATRCPFCTSELQPAS